MEIEKAAALEEINDRWGEIANQITEIPVTPYKKDVMIDLFGLAWQPYFIAQNKQELSELPGFQAG